MIKIGIDNFDNKRPVDNCKNFELEKHDGWNRNPCHTGFAIGEFLDSELYEYVDTKSEDNFIYPINFKCFTNGLGITMTELWEDELDINVTFLDLIPNHVLEKVRNGKVKILLNYGFEENDIHQRDTILYLEEFLVGKLNEKNIPISNVYYTDSNYELDLSKTKYIKTFSQNFTANSFYISDGEVGSNIDHFKLSKKQIEKKQKTKLLKKYICYNRLEKPHRKQVVDWIKNNNYLEDGYVSFPPDLTLDYTNFNDNWAYHRICTDHFDTSFLSIVNESHFGNFKHCFLTEKTWKAVFNFHPFVIVGAKGSLGYLKKHGFDIFEDIIDSSYDTIDNSELRLKQIFNILDDFFKSHTTHKLQKIRESMFPRLLHNYNYFWNDFRKEISLKFYKDMEKINGK
tara:strand:+ start:2798 stop:3994 length:1197 start_codon:yes stop_codon:yes gene_type:complete